ncbi:fatty acid synthase [Anabrus simplex]|uniref:fatty acid synthase n=1 Tax=Anabrus simplex TaxID=316456 RepID=UPI0035A2FD00
MDPSIQREEVVISGISGTFPYSNNIDELRENLFNKENLVLSDDCRWSTTAEVPNATGKICNPSKFDSFHFGTHRKLAESMDPLMYITLEKSYEAIMDAGVNPNSLKRTKTSVIISSCYSEADNVFDFEKTGDGFGIMGHNRSMLATRVAYYLDVNGPSYAVLSTWAGGYTALSIAYNSIRTGRCRAAIVGTANLALFPQMSQFFNKLGLLSPDGVTRSFDASANGYGRSEATVMLFLQRKQDAKRVYAEVLHTDTLCYGDRRQFITLTPDIMTKHLENFYNSCDIDPAQVEYLEADGSASLNSDCLELNAVDEVMLRHRKTPLLIGSVKSNIGHTESSASMCAVAKVLIAMDTGYIPPNMHYSTPVPGVPALRDGRLKVVTEKLPWKGGLAAINSFGIDGTCSHTVLKSLSKEKLRRSDNLPRLVTVSSRTEEAVHNMLTKIEAMPPDPEFIRLLHDIHEINIPTHLYRGYTIVGSERTGIQEVQHFEGVKRPVWFIFSGMGSQWPGMGRHLLQLPVFAEVIDRCHAILEPKGVDLKKILTDEDPHTFDTILNSFVGIAAVQAGLLVILQKLGIKPDGIIGHSVGELGCSLADGCFTEEEMILCAYSRGRASMEANIITGMMAAVGLSHEKVKPLLPAEIDIACHNGPDSCTISGPVDAMKAFVEELTKKGIFARLVNVSNIAYHSRYIAPVGPLLLKYLKDVLVQPKQRSPRWISTSVPEKDWNLPQWQFSTPEYHTNNLLSSVLFEEGCRHIPSNAICIEISPHGLLQAILRRSLGSACTNISLTQRGNKQGLEFLLQAIGKLYMLGLQPKLAEIFPPVSLPVSRGTPSISSLVEWEHTDDWPIISYLESNLTSGVSHVQLSLTHEDTRFCNDYVLGGHVVLPVTAHLKMAWTLLTSIFNINPQEMTVVFQNVVFHQPVIIHKEGSVELYLSLQRGSGMFEIVMNNKVVTTGQMIIPEDASKEFTRGIPTEDSSWTDLSKEDIYKELKNRGYHHNGAFQAISSATLSETCSVGKIKWCNNWVAFTDCMLQLAILRAHEDSQDLQYPASLRRFVVDMKVPEMKQGEELEVVAHRTTGITRCKGMEIHGLQTQATDFNSKQNINFQIYKQQFVNHLHPTFKSVDNFIEISLQLALENYHPSNRSRNHVSIAELKSNNTFIPIVENITKTMQNTWVDVDTITWPNVKELKYNCILVLTTESLAKAGTTLIADSGAFLLVRIADSIIWQPDQGMVVVMEQNCEGHRLFLLRKEAHVDKSATTIQMHEDRAVWLNQLRGALQTYSRIYLVSHCEPPCGIPNFLDNLAVDCSVQNIRCIFILDKTAPPFSLKHEVYKKQLAQDLAINVYQKGQWGSYRTLPLREEAEESKTISLTQFGLKEIDVHYAAPIVTESGEEGKKHELGSHSYMEFSGVNSKGERVMGLALNESQHLIWPVPSSWSLEEAATVPEAYTLAYYALKLLGNVSSRDKVLIHSGITVTSQAAIMLALSLGATVFTSVTSEQQRQLIKKHFPQLTDSQILDASTALFESQLLEATQGKGVSLVISDITDERMKSTFHCIKIFGQMIQLGKNNFTKIHQMGMSHFVKSLALHSVSIAKLINISEKKKQKLQAAVQQGITNGTVKPLERVVCSRHRADEANQFLVDLSNSKKILLDMRNELKKGLDSRKQGVLLCNPLNSYLIFGGKGDDWLNLAVWLVKEGARKLVIAQQSQPVTSYLARRVGLLRSCHGVDIVLLSAHKASTPLGALSLIREANSSGPLGGIFILPLQSRESVDSSDWDSSTLQAVNNLDSASRNSALQYFVCLQCYGVERVFETRQQLGLPALALLDGVRSKHQDGIQTLLLKLSTLLTLPVEPVIIVNAIHQNTDNASGHVAIGRLNTLLSTSVRDLVDLGATLKKKTVVVEVPTLSLGLAHVKEVPPIFLLPSLLHSSGEALKPLLNKLIYPTCLLKMGPKAASLEEYATQLLQHMKLVHPSGPYILVGDLWGGVVAIELAGQLEAQGHQTQVFLLDGAPEILQKTVALLGEGSQLEVNLLEKLFSITSDKMKQNLLNLPNWESRLNLILEGLSYEAEIERSLLSTAVDTIHSHISNLVLYKPQHQIKGPVTLIVPTVAEEDNISIIKFCKHTVNIHKIGEDHKAMLTSSTSSDIINNTLIVP